MEVFPARNGTPSPRLELRPFELDVQRVHEAVHQAAKGSDRRQLDDLGAVEVLGEPRERIIVETSFVPRYKLSPSDDRLLTFTEKRTFEVAIDAERIELLLGPASGSPDQAIVLYSVLTRVERRDLDHRQRTGLGVELAAKAVLLEHRLKRQKEFHDRGRVGKDPHRIGDSTIKTVRRLERGADVFRSIVILNEGQPGHS